jgi:acyl-CoA synthetase (AMP-forming)/AMP-acid ligase II
MTHSPHLTQSLHRAKRETPYDIAMIDGPSRTTWDELEDKVCRFAHLLQRLGLKPGDRVGLLADNRDDFLIFFLGALWAGGVANPVNTRWTPSEIAYSLNDCDTRILFFDSRHRDRISVLQTLVSGLKHVICLNPGDPEGGDLPALLDRASTVADVRRGGDDLAVLLYTGGTTGRPKGVMLSHRALLASALGYIGCPGCTIGPAILHTAPLFHVGAISGVIAGLLCRSTHVFMPAFEPEALMRTIVANNVSDVFLVPTMIQTLLDHPSFGDHDLGCLRKILYGAAPITPALMDRIAAALPGRNFVQAYGMTELAPVVTVLAPDDHRGPDVERKLRSAGRSTAVVEVRIADGNDEAVAHGVAGEIQVRGETMMSGYWNRPEETAVALRGGWMHTGDVGVMDDRGYVTIVDRLKDMIVTGGENVYSVEVEGALATHPGVAGCAVVGRPDEKWGEAIHAVIVPAAGVHVDEAQLTAHCRSLIAGYKVPRSFEFRASLPLSAAGKILKHELRREAADATAAAG